MSNTACVTRGAANGGSQAAGRRAVFRRRRAGCGVGGAATVHGHRVQVVPS